MASPRKCLDQEDAIEDDHREVMALLEGNYADAPSYAEDAPPSPPHEEQNNPNQSLPSMLDVSPGPLPARHGSIAGIGVGVTPPAARRSKGLDLEPASSPLRLSSLATSPPAYKGAVGSGHGNTPTEKKPGGNSSDNSQLDVTADTPDRSSINDHQPPSPERAPSKAVQGRHATGAVVGAFEPKVPPGTPRGRDYGQRNSPRGLSLDSRLSHAGRSGSPRGSRGPGVSLPAPGTRRGRWMLDDGTTSSKRPPELSSGAESSKSKGNLTDFVKPPAYPRYVPNAGIDSRFAERIAEDAHDHENDPFVASEEGPDVNSGEGDASSTAQKEPERHVRIKSTATGPPADAVEPGTSKFESRKGMIDEAEEDGMLNAQYLLGGPFRILTNNCPNRQCCFTSQTNLVFS